MMNQTKKTVGKKTSMTFNQENYELKLVIGKNYTEHTIFFFKDDK